MQGLNWNHRYSSNIWRLQYSIILLRDITLRDAPHRTRSAVVAAIGSRWWREMTLRSTRSYVHLGLGEETLKCDCWQVHPLDVRCHLGLAFYQRYFAENAFGIERAQKSGVAIVMAPYKE